MPCLFLFERYIKRPHESSAIEVIASCCILLGVEVGREGEKGREGEGEGEGGRGKGGGREGGMGGEGGRGREGGRREGGVHDFSYACRKKLRN